MPANEKIDVGTAIAVYSQVGGLQFKPAGRWQKARCPFHQEKTASFGVDDTGKFKCFGCGAFGDVFDFLELLSGLDFRAAKEKLQTEFHVDLGGYESNSRGVSRNQLLSINEIACNWYHKTLIQLSASHPASCSLVERKITPDLCKRFRLGYGGDDPRHLYGHLRKGFEDSVLVESGLFDESHKGNGLLDSLCGRLIFPVIELSGVVAFSGRLLSSQSNDGTKYRNTRNTCAFTKSSTLFNNLKVARNSISELGYAIVAEGYMDVISLVGHGIENVLGAMGAVLTEQHMNALSPITRRVMIFFDDDRAADAGVISAAEKVISAAMECRIIRIPGIHDPDELCRKHSHDDAFLAISANVWKIEDFLLKFSEKTFGGKSSFADRTVALFAKVFRNSPFPSVKQGIVNFLSDRLRIHRDFVIEAMLSDAYKKLEAADRKLEREERKQEREQAEAASCHS